MLETTVDLVHLVWTPLGMRPFERFLAAYSENPPGLPANLTILFSGFSSAGQLRPYRDHLREAGVSANEVELPGPGFDIASYRAAAARQSGAWICFLNSYSRPLAGGWLEQLLAPQFRDPDLRLTGVGGNLVSAFWHLPAESTLGFSRLPIRGWLQRRRFRQCVDRQLRDFPPGPGPVIRTNAFALRRDDFLRLRFPVIRTKYETYLFESGWVSMTRQVLGAGYRVAVVGRDGRAYRPPEWPESRTYASGDQGNLLVADNRTDMYQEAGEEQRADMYRAAYCHPPRTDYAPYLSRNADPMCSFAASFPGKGFLDSLESSLLHANRLRL
jgi:hypothetical protein